MCAQHIEHLAQTIRNDQNPARAFEHMLARLNEDFARLGPELELRKEKCHAIFAVCAKNQLFLSGFGNLLALFLHKTADRRFSIYELHTQFSEQIPTWEKMFSAVLDGDLHEGDIFYAATHIPSHILTLSELQDMLVTLPSQGALERLEGFIPPAMPFAGVTAHVMSKESHRAAPRVNPIGSLEVLNKTQDRTAEILGERQAGTSGMVAPKKLKWLGRQEPGAIATKVGSFAWQGLQAAVAKTAVLLGNDIKNIAGAVKRRKLRETRHASRHTMPVEKNKTSIGMRLRGATASPLGILLIVGTLALAGVGSFFLFRQNGDEEARATLFAGRVSDVSSHLASAEASLIYKNTDSAKADLATALATFETLSPQTSDEKNQSEQLRNKITSLQQQIQGLSPVAPETVATLAQNTTTFTSAVKIGSDIYATGADLALYRLNRLEKQWTKEIGTNGIVGTPKTATTESDTAALFIDGTQHLGRINATTKTLNPITSGLDGLASAEDISAYNGTLYALTAKSQQIVKMRPQGDGYEAGTLWITAATSDITSARALTIDGNIYVLTQNNVRSYFSGREQTWQPAAFDPALVNPTDIYTNPDSAYLYILDPGSSRIIVLKKADGSLVAQYVNDAFASAVSFMIDETNNSMTVITSTAALDFTPRHLVQ